jgi:hypothetical protein
MGASVGAPIQTVNLVAAFMDAATSAIHTRPSGLRAQAYR